MLIKTKQQEYNKAYQALQEEKEKLQLLTSTKAQTLNIVTDITKAVNANAFQSVEEKQKALELRALGKIGLKNIAEQLPIVKARIPQLRETVQQLLEEINTLQEEELSFQKQHNTATLEGTIPHEQVIQLSTMVPKRLEIYTEKGFNLKLLPFKRAHTFVVDTRLTGKKLEVVVFYEEDRSQSFPVTMPPLQELVEFTLSFELKYGDGEQEFAVLVNGYANEEEGGDISYWDSYLLEVVEDETGMEAEDMLYLDGDADGGILSDNGHFHLRAEKGKAAAHVQAPILLKRLKKNAEGKIVQRIKVFTHSRGAAYGNAFVDELLVIFQEQHADKFADPNNIFDSMTHLDPHQSKKMVVQDHTFPSYSASHYGSVLGDNYAKGDIINMETDGWPGDKSSHPNGTFPEELKDILYQHNTNTIEGNGKYEGFEGLLEKERTFTPVEESKKDREDYDPDEIMDTNFGDVF